MRISDKTDTGVVMACAEAYITLSEKLYSFLSANARACDDAAITESLSQLQAVVESNGYKIGDSGDDPLKPGDELQRCINEAKNMGFEVRQYEHISIKKNYFVDPEGNVSAALFAHELDVWRRIADKLDSYRKGDCPSWDSGRLGP